MPISHIGLNVRDMDEATSFYSAALKPLGYKMRMEFVDGEVRGFGASACGPDFWLAGPNAPGADGSETRHQRGGVEGKTEVKEEARRKLSGPVHVAFAAKDRGKVRSFYEEALKAGGKCNGPPGVREEYFSTYYAAFVLDPEGRNIEAVCMMPAFWAEKWGCVGWSAVAVVAAAVGAGVGRWWGIC